MHPQARSRPRTPNGPIAVLLGSVLLASCAHVAPPPPPPQPPPARPVAERPRLHPVWSFQTGPNACLAVATAGHTRLLVAVRRKQPIRLSVTTPYDTAGQAVAHFHGPAGAWIASGWHAGGHEIVFTLGRDMDSLSRVLMLLSGGVMDLDAPEKNLPIFILPAAGPHGQQWFGCARKLVI
ncbi:MAG TPA: hypothetical protein VFN42_14180 [Acetobacteraceae bacterium]|nr:hypothetical protein [Acetobacteraceae bacterium]